MIRLSAIFLLLSAMSLEALSQPSPSEPLRIEDATVTALDPIAGRAVVRWPDGTSSLLRLGDEMPFSATVRAVLKDRLVLTETAAGEPRTVWIYRAEAGKSRIRILEANPGPPVRRLKPRSGHAEVRTALDGDSVRRVSTKPLAPAEPPPDEGETAGGGV